MGGRRRRLVRKSRWSFIEVWMKTEMRNRRWWRRRRVRVMLRETIIKAE